MKPLLLAALLLSGRHPTPAFDPSGRLWLAFVEGDFIYVTSSDDLGRHFSPAVAVNREPEPIDANGEARPKIAVGLDGTLFVAWTRKLDEPYTGLIRFSRSTDAGRSFSPPLTLNDDGLVTGHRFEALSVAPSGEVLVAWIDKRDLNRAEAEGRAYPGAAIYLAVSRDSGRSFEPNRKVADHVCECCRLSFSFDRAGRAALLFRGVLEGGIRDHVLARDVSGSQKPPIQRVTFDDWKIDACPHHGPSLAIDGSDAFHVAWFTAGERSGTGVFYARSDDGGASFSPPVPVGDPARASHPVVLATGHTLFLAWMESDGKKSDARFQLSRDGGRTWSPPEIQATGGPAADHPQLVQNGEDVFLSWFAKDIGYRLIPLTSAAGAERLVGRMERGVGADHAQFDQTRLATTNPR